MNIGAVALEQRMRLDTDENIQIPCRSAAHADFTFTRKPDARPFLDTGWNRNGQRFFLAHAPGSGADAAGIFDDFTAALAGGTGALDGKKSLRHAHAAIAV